MASIPLQFLFSSVFLLIVYLVQRFWFSRAWRLLNRLRQPGWRNALRVLWFVSASIIFVAVLDSSLGHFLPRTGRLAAIALFARLWLSVSFLALAAVGFTSVFNWLSKSALAVAAPLNLERIDQGRRAFFRSAAYFAASIPFVAGAYGFFKERLSFQIQKIEIPVADLPPALDGMTIVQLSDIHAGDFMPRSEIRRAVAMANDLGADLAVVTGDFITSASDPLEDCITELSRLRAPLGVWGCNGNHEIYAGAEDRAQQLFDRFGMRLLRQQNAELSWRGEKFNLIGVDYQRERTASGKKLPMLRGAEPLVRNDIPNILLSHNPNSFRRAAELGIQLSLAGHTHGGQVQVEIVDHSFSPARFMTHFIAGLYRLPVGSNSAAPSSSVADGVPTLAPAVAGAVSPSDAPKRAFCVPDGLAGHAALYVNRGLGTIGMPVRLGVPPEITLITLRAPASS
ncbi:MAG: metallophosphoesterase [Candidatus Acidiferrales bacterium]